MIIVKDKNKVINEVSSGESFKMIAKTMYGLEEVLAEELRALGAKDVTPINRAVAFTGTMQTLYKANYACRTALAIQSAALARRLSHVRAKTALRLPNSPGHTQTFCRV